jgi:HprK-related kinase A
MGHSQRSTVIRDLDFAALSARLRGPGLVLNTGAFRVRLRSDVEGVVRELASAYANHQVIPEPAIHHLRIDIRRGRWRGFGRDRGVSARVDGRSILSPFPTALAYPMLESILNWCIAKSTLRFVVFHAGAVERGGRATILTGPSGSGKSTLCAALSSSGWRLISDELVLLNPEGPALVGNPRPISLKNEAIERIRELGPAASFTQAYEGTIRGTISFLCPSADSVARAYEPAVPNRVVFPSFRPGSGAQVTEIERAQGFMRLIENSVNYVTTLRTGFEAVASVTEGCRFYELTFGDLEAAFAALENLAPDGAPK